MEIDAMKSCLEHIGLDGGDILHLPITVQVVKAMPTKRNQAQEKFEWIVDMYEVVEKAMADTRVN
jgi:RNAse (barnase) inhibitor barstar